MQEPPGKLGTLRKPATSEGIRSEGKPEREIAGTAEGTRKMAQTIGIGRRLSQRERGRGNPEPKPRLSGKIKNAANPQLDRQA